MTDVSPHPPFPTTKTPGCPFDPPAAYAKLRVDDPVSKAACPAGVDAWVVTRYEDIRSVLSDRRFSSRGAIADHMRPEADLDAEITPGNIIKMDGTAHARLRRMLTAEFTVRRIEKVRPYIQQIVEQHIDAMLSGPKPVDLYDQFSVAVPAMVTCELLGVPYADRAYFQRQSTALMSIDQDGEAIYAVYMEMFGYFAKLFEAKQAEPADDLMSRLIERAAASGEPLTGQEMATLCVTLLIAGLDTTSNMITLSTLALLEHPEELAKLRQNPDIVANAAEELLRHLPIVQFGLLRYATEDVELEGATVKAGDWLVAAVSSGNRDESVYRDADRMDLTRSMKTHLSFGFGIHQCIGQQLARVMLQEVYGRLFRRIPTLRLAVPASDLRYKETTLTYGVHELPVTWDD